VNGQPQDEPFIKEQPSYMLDKMTVPAGDVSAIHFTAVRLRPQAQAASCLPGPLWFAEQCSVMYAE